MEKRALEQILSSDYNQSSWIELLKNVFRTGELFREPQLLPPLPGDIADRGFHLGNFSTGDGYKIGVYEVHLKSTVKLHRNRVGVRNLLSRYYKQLDGVFAVFKQGQTWRFSFISQLRDWDDEQNEWVLKETEPKRYTYLLGEDEAVRTAVDRFYRLLESGSVMFEDIKEAFSVEKLNKEFYQELSNWYFWTIKNVRFPHKPKQKANEKDTEFYERLKTHRSQNVIRLITRLIFAWFIKEKNLVPANLFDHDYISQVIDLGDSNDSNYYKAILQNLFFATFNQQMDEREFRNDSQNFGATQLYRYRRFFKDPESALDLFKDIPFLNGGLFECLDKRGEKEKKEDRKYIDGFSDNLPKEHQLTVPNYLFFGDERKVDLSKDYGQKVKKFKEAVVRGIIPILNRYAFTIAENTPLEEEVALNPELLGKVFENLLASYNPETKKTARKQTGSYYTPREIVNYMVDESMIAYLKNEITKEENGYYVLGSSSGDMFGNSARKGQLEMEHKGTSNPWQGKEDELEEKLRTLFSYTDEQPFKDPSHKKALINAIDNCEVLDPACGSGAFPMGMLQKMVHVLQKLDPQNEEWKERQIAKAQALDDPKIREDLIEDIEQAFENNELDFGRKLYLIENCIYGVDIQPIAVQISKLRFFISLVVDQIPDKTRDNLGIRPLPNLETRFVAANTLIGLNNDGQQTLRNTRIEELEKQLEQVRHQHFSAKSPKTKLKKRKEDKEIRGRIANLLINDGWDDQTAYKLARWDPYNQTNSASYFDPEWMFGVKEGFDVVIGNPPYVFTRDVDFGGNFKKYVDENYFSRVKREKRSKSIQSGKINLFAVFIMKGLFIVKTNGVLTFILPNNILRTTTYDIIRKYILNNSKIRQIVDLGNGIFESVTASTIVLNLLKQTQKLNTNIEIITDIQDIEQRYFDLKKIDQKQFSKNVSHSFNIFMDKESIKISNQIKKEGIVLSEFCTDNIEGIVAHKYLIHDRKAKNTVPLIEGKDIKRFFIKPPSNFLTWNKDKIHRTRPDYLWGSDKKIIIQRISGGSKPLVSSVDDNRYKTFASTNNILLKNIYENHYYFIAGLINSDVLNWYYANNFSNNSKLTVNISKTYMSHLPIAKFSSEVSLISKLLHYLMGKSPAEVLLKIMNSAVFELYFSIHMEEQKIDVLELVKQDISSVIQDRDFEQLSDSEKEEVIDQLEAKWSDPQNEVRKRINSFPEKSPDILKPILEGGS
jgi:tRNA1(Val) A37 N6-methylase TrmN6